MWIIILILSIPILKFYAQLFFDDVLCDFTRCYMQSRCGLNPERERAIYHVRLQVRARFATNQRRCTPKATKLESSTCLPTLLEQNRPTLSLRSSSQDLLTADCSTFKNENCRAPLLAGCICGREGSHN